MLNNCAEFGFAGLKLFPMGQIFGIDLAPFLKPAV